MLAEYFAAYKERHPGDLALAFVGPVSDKAPDHPDIVVTGTVSEADKWDILAGAPGLWSHPSAYESFSLVLLEAWTVGVPVLVNAACAATMEHCRRSGGGPLVRLLPVVRGGRRSTGRRPGLRSRWARPGRRYTARYYRWPSIIDRYTRFLEGVVARGQRAPAADRTAAPRRRCGPEYVRGG